MGEGRNYWRLALVGLSLMAALSATAGAQSSTSPEARLKALGIELPAPPKPIASYVTAVRTGNDGRGGAGVAAARASAT